MEQMGQVFPFLFSKSVKLFCFANEENKLDCLAFFVALPLIEVEDNGLFFEEEKSNLAFVLPTSLLFVV